MISLLSFSCGLASSNLQKMMKQQMIVRTLRYFSCQGDDSSSLKRSILQQHFDRERMEEEEKRKKAEEKKQQEAFEDILDVTILHGNIHNLSSSQIFPHKLSETVSSETIPADASIVDSVIKGAGEIMETVGDVAKALGDSLDS